MIAVFGLMLTLPFMEILVWFVLLVADPAVLRQKWLYIAALRVGLICGLAVAAFIYTPLWSIALGPEADEWRDYNGFMLAFNAIGGTILTLVLWSASTVIPQPTISASKVR
jgi:hypothetical protein